MIDRKVSSFYKALANKSLVNVQLSKTQLSNIIQLDVFLGRLLRPLRIVRLLLMKNVLTPLAKSLFIPLGLTVTVSAADARIHEKVLGSGTSETFGLGTTTLIISNKETKDIIKIVKSLKHSGLLRKGATQTIENEAKEQWDEFSGIFIRYITTKFMGKHVSM